MNHPYRPAQLHGSVLVVLACMVILLPANARALSSRIWSPTTGEGPGVSHGYSVASAGDLNADGYEDAIVGAISYASTAGRAYVYFGGAQADTVADLVLTGQTGDLLGSSVASAGDMNGDGYDDVIVGAPSLSGGVGRALVLFGGPNVDAIPDLILMAGNVGGRFGGAVSAVDINGDGYGDVIVGAPNEVTSDGAAYVFYGGPVPDVAPDLIMIGPVNNGGLGTSVACVGDMNGDGYDDVIAGASATSPGRAYLYYGGADPDTTADLTFVGGGGGDLFGRTSAAAGDVNGDGYGDVIVGAHGHDSYRGRAYVFFGGTGADAVPDVTLSGAATSDQFGVAVAGAGDVDGDGYADVIVGSAAVNRVHLFLGGPAFDTMSDLTWTGTEYSQFGQSVSSAGDVNRDGFPDVIIGAPTDNGSTGRVSIQTIFQYQVVMPNGGEQWIAGTPSTIRWQGNDRADIAISHDGGATWSTLASGVGGLQENEFTLTAPSLESEFAKVRVSVHGQVPRHGTSDASDGVFRIVKPFRPPGAAARLHIAPTGQAPQDDYGLSVASAGDMNGDGYGDVVVGAFRAGGDGRAYVYFGGPGSDAVADLTLMGEGAGSFFGFGRSVTSVDMNGDGYDDVIVGAQSLDAMLPGMVFLFLGGPAPDGMADLGFWGDLSQGFGFGSSVASAGDVNADGYEDLIVGDFMVNQGQGAAYVFHGGPSMDNSPDVTLDGLTDNDQLGESVASAGDWNGDGFGDVIVGSGWHGFGNGAAFLYLLGPGNDNVADLSFEGATSSSRFGASVAFAGDTNGDGFGDVIVGAWGHANGTGRTYVFHGGPGADGVADLTMNGESTSNHFGFAAGSAGDVNADGFGDLVVGAYGYGLASGRAYVFYGGPGADATHDLVLAGEGGPQSFGVAVASAGDIDRDGHGDLIVGANGYSNYTGRAYVFTTSRYFLTTPNGGETWNVGATKTVSWLGAEPADLWLSLDGGLTHERIERGVGGQHSNSMSIRVPHTPTKFARIKVTPTDAWISGFDRSDSLFTIQTSIALLALLAAPAPEGERGTTISWQTDPGPDDLAGYRLERAGTAGGSATWRTIVSLTRETSHTDPEGGPGSRYRLFAVNGFGEELLLGEAAIRPAVALSAWPLPYRGGVLQVSFATAGGLGGGNARTELAVYDVHGRLMRTIDAGTYPAGHRMATWDGRDSKGREAPAGVYFLRARGHVGYERSMKITVLR